VTNEPKGVAYIISQIGDPESAIRKRADEVADFVIRPVVEELRLVPMRSDRDPTPGQVTSRLLKDILAARVVVADLTGRNPNVYYELAVAHSFGRPVVIVVDHVESLSFDTKNERVIVIGDEGVISVTEAENAKSKLKEALNLVLADGYVPNSLVREVASSQSLDELAPRDPVAEQLANMSRRLDQVYAAVRRGRRETEPGARDEDLRSLVQLVRKLIASERLEDDEVTELVTEETTRAFDDWVRSLASKHGYTDPIEQFEASVEEDEEDEEES
jgi:hypothetical protein